MIKFFRKIRQNLLQEGNSMKYFKYAIGEIILVVLGILIALQINNWNEQQKASRWEQQFLKELNTELQYNLEQLKTVREVQSQKIQSGRAILSLLSSKDPSSKSRIDSLFTVNQESNQTFFPTTGVYDLGLASGKMENLKDKTLKYTIMNLYNHFYKRLVYNGELQDRAEDQFDWVKRSYYDIVTRQIKSWSMIIDPEFESQIQFSIDQTEIYYGLVEKSISKIDDAIQMVEQQIKK